MVLKQVSAFSKPPDSLVTTLNNSSEITNATHFCEIITFNWTKVYTNSSTERGMHATPSSIPWKHKIVEMWSVLLEPLLLSQ